MNYRLFLNLDAGVLLAFASFALSVRPILADEKKDRANALDKELAHLRESLHDAQQELAKRNERIEDLEEQLVAAKAGVQAEGALQRKVPEERARRMEAAGKKPEPKSKTAAKPAPEKVAKAPDGKSKSAKSQAGKTSEAPQSQRRLFTVSYEKNSAANLEEREAALSWVRGQLKDRPALGLKIVGSANDREDPEVNREIALNRARFLGDYLVAYGVPREAIVVTEATLAKTGADTGRSAVIQIVPRGPRAEK